LDPVVASLESLPTWLAGVVVVGGFVLTTLAMGLLVARFTSGEIRSAHNDRAGFILAVIGVVYAVLLGFVAIGVWERFDAAQTRSYDEATELATVYRDADSFPGGNGLRNTLVAYAKSVISQEWPKMSRGIRIDAPNPLLELADHQVRALPVDSARTAGIQVEMLGAITAALMDRQTRLTIDFIGINSIMWVVLLAGAYVTVAFTYLFGFERTVMQQLMIGGLSLIIGLVLFLTLALDYPFRGSIAVGPGAFQSLLVDWNNNAAAEPLNLQNPAASK
jgi:hypothetical protein